MNSVSSLDFRAQMMLLALQGINHLILLQSYCIKAEIRLGRLILPKPRSARQNKGRPSTHR